MSHGIGRMSVTIIGSEASAHKPRDAKIAYLAKLGCIVPAQFGEKLVPSCRQPMAPNDNQNLQKDAYKCAKHNTDILSTNDIHIPVHIT